LTNRTDNFNRADSAVSLGTPSDSGSAWVVPTASFGISSNQGYKANTASTHEVAYLESSVADVDVEVTLTAIGASAAGGVCARFADDSNYLHAQCGTGGTPVYLFKRVAGSFTQLGSTYGGTLVANDVMKLTCNGSSLTVYINGVSRITATDSAGSTNTKHGLYAYSANTDSPLFDTFSITAAGGSGPVTVGASGSACTVGVGTQAPVTSIGL
jgi:hypothetical protein